MKRLLFALTLAAVAACYDNSSSPSPFLVVNPILDSMFVGDVRPSRSVTLYDANGQPQNPGPVTWTVDADTAAVIDADGTIHGVGRGEAVIFAHAAGLTPGRALVIVSRPLDLTLLMDTVYLMPTDTFTIPLAIQQKPPVTQPATVWFTVPLNAVDTLVDSAAGLVKALATGGPIRYIAHVTTGGVNTVSDTGAVVVKSLSDTTGGRFFMTIVGTAIRHEGGPARAMNYTKQNGDLAFRLTDSLISASLYEKVYITLPTAVLSTGPFEIDSLHPQEAATSLATLSAFCNPPRPWALWSSILPLPGVRAFSNTADKQAVAGELGITQRQAVSGGYAISGRFQFTAQRTDLYDDTLGIVTVRGTFVAPLITNTTICQP